MKQGAKEQSVEKTAHKVSEKPLRKPNPLLKRDTLAKIPKAEKVCLKSLMKKAKELDKQCGTITLLSLKVFGGTISHLFEVEVFLPHGNASITRFCAEYRNFLALKRYPIIKGDFK